MYMPYKLAMSSFSFIGIKPKMVKGDDGEDDEVTLCLVSKQIAIHRLPPVLILHLKRFSIERGGVFKDNQHIRFPFKLNVAPYCTTQCINVCYKYCYPIHHNFYPSCFAMQSSQFIHQCIFLANCFWAPICQWLVLYSSYRYCASQ